MYNPHPQHQNNSKPCVDSACCPWPAWRQPPCLWRRVSSSANSLFPPSCRNAPPPTPAATAHPQHGPAPISTPPPARRLDRKTHWRRNTTLSSLARVLGACAARLFVRPRTDWTSQSSSLTTIAAAPPTPLKLMGSISIRAPRFSVAYPPRPALTRCCIFFKQ